MRREKGVQEGFNTFLNALFLFHFISKMFSFFLQSNSQFLYKKLIFFKKTIAKRRVYLL